jgi:hypothetical protein
LGIWIVATGINQLLNWLLNGIDLLLTWLRLSPLGWTVADDSVIGYVGASLVQIYTGLVYEGPGVVREIVAGLAARVRAAVEVHGLRQREAQRALRLESLIRAAAEVEGGRYRAGSLKTSTADDVLAPVLRVFDMLAARHAPAEPPTSTPWDGASVVIDSKHIEDLRAQVVAARAQQKRVEEP